MFNAGTGTFTGCNEAAANVLTQKAARQEHSLEAMKMLCRESKWGHGDGNGLRTVY